MSELQQHKKVKIVFEAEYNRPPFITTEGNIDNVEKFHGKNIKEIIQLDEKGKEIVAKKADKVVTKIIEKQMSDLEMVVYLESKNIKFLNKCTDDELNAEVKRRKNSKREKEKSKSISQA